MTQPVPSRPGSAGQATVEFALTAVLLLIIVFGLFDATRAVWQASQLAHAVREGTRYAIVHGSLCESPCVTATDQDVKDVVKRNAAGVAIADADITVTWPDKDPGQTVTVRASALFTPVVSALFRPFGPITLHEASTMVIQQ